MKSIVANVTKNCPAISVFVKIGQNKTDTQPEGLHAFVTTHLQRTHNPPTREPKGSHDYY
jgi:hypothetical protein